MTPSVPEPRHPEPQKIIGVACVGATTVTFCHTSELQLALGDLVRIGVADGEAEGEVVIEAGTVKDLPNMELPLVTAVLQRTESDGSAPVDEVVELFVSSDGVIGDAELRRALYLASLPITEPPPRSR